MVKTGKVSLSVAGVTVANVTKCSLEYARETIEATGITDAVKKRLPGMRNWSVSADSAIEFADASGHAKLIKAMNEGNSIGVRIQLDDSFALSGAGYIDSLSVGINSGEYATVSISITGSGALEFTA